MSGRRCICPGSLGCHGRGCHDHDRRRRTLVSAAGRANSDANANANANANASDAGCKCNVVLPGLPRGGHSPCHLVACHLAEPSRPDLAAQGGARRGLPLWLSLLTLAFGFGLFAVAADDDTPSRGSVAHGLRIV